MKYEILDHFRGYFTYSPWLGIGLLLFPSISGVQRKGPHFILLLIILCRSVLKKSEDSEALGIHTPDLNSLYTPASSLPIPLSTFQ